METLIQTEILVKEGSLNINLRHTEIIDKLYLQNQPFKGESEKWCAIHASVGDMLALVG